MLSMLSLGIKVTERLWRKALSLALGVTLNLTKMMHITPAEVDLVVLLGVQFRM